MDPAHKQERIAWLLVAAWTTVIYLTVPAARTIQHAVAGTLGRPFFLYSVLGCGLLTTAGAVRYLITVQRIRNPLQYLVLGLVAGLFGYLTWSLRKNPEEAVHYVEYGILAALAFRALRHRQHDTAVYFSAAALVCLAGTFDEIIQWMIPGRTWDFRDVWINFSAGGLVMLGLGLGIRPRTVDPRVSRSSYLLSARLATAALLLIGVCYSNSPAAVYWYSGYLPFLKGWRTNEPMSEFGYRYDDPHTGVFFSRLAPEDLRMADKTRVAENTAFLTDSLAAEKNYGAFLQTHNPYSNPFLYEMRIHLFRRDRHLKAMGDNLKHLWYSVVIDRESKILEKYFGNTYRRSPFWWPPEKLRPFTENATRWKKGYTSLVSYTITTSYRLGTVWMLIGSLLAIIWLVPLTAYRRR